MKKPSIKSLVISALIGVSFMSVSFGTSFALLTDRSESRIEVSSAIFRIDTLQTVGDLVLSEGKTVTIPTGLTQGATKTITVKARSLSNVKIKYRLFTDFSEDDDLSIAMTSTAMATGHTASVPNATNTKTLWTDYDPGATPIDVDLENVEITFTAKRETLSAHTVMIIYETVQGNRGVIND